jgi:hypothetical protein
LFRVALYRLLLKIEVHPVQKIKSHQIKGAFFCSPPKQLLISNNDIYSHIILKNGYFPFSGDYIIFGEATPNWHKNYFNNSESKSKNLDWWKISDFDSNLGDIKTVWELSRFDWVVQLAITAVSGDKYAVHLLNSRLNDWIEENPYYKGVNWKCGQEASIRVLHLILAALILDQSKNSSKPLISLIEAHIKRIAPTISYAIAQNNNHGTSEAAALFTGGHFLVSNGLLKYENYELLGRNWLEDRATKLFSSDGCFSQYSVNYHRLALDTYTYCETYRKFYNLKPFSSILTKKIKKAIHWLEILTDPNTGDVPNLGANDGAQLFKMFINGYRDFRQSVQWANLVFNDRLIYSITENQVKLFKHLKINVETAHKDYPIMYGLILGNEDGFFIYRKEKLLLVFRRPKFKFRPSHSDALHVDFWINGMNILRDGGSYSYNTIAERSSYYNGIESHNSIQFDFRDQMPKLSRFLFGSWLKENRFYFDNTNDYLKITSGYEDYAGVKHKRSIILNENTLKILDDISGYKILAKLRLRLFPSVWMVENATSEDSLEIDINSKVIKGNVLLEKFFESRFYFSETEVPIVLKEIWGLNHFTTTIRF